MKLVIMTGGKGARLGPMTKDIPKPMIPVGGKPILEHIIETAKKHGIRKSFFVMATYTRQSGIISEMVANGALILPTPMRTSH